MTRKFDPIRLPTWQRRTVLIVLIPFIVPVALWGTLLALGPTLKVAVSEFCGLVAHYWNGPCTYPACMKEGCCANNHCQGIDA